MTKEEKIAHFDPNGLASTDELFGLPFTAQESELWILPVPWEVTVSYSSGTASGPAAIKEASLQVDLYDPLLPGSWKRGIYLLEENKTLQEQSTQYRAEAERWIAALEEGDALEQSALERINAACRKMVEQVKLDCGRALDEGKKLILLGGDHSTPLGYIQALAERHSSFGILQIDAHADLRIAYEDFEYSHASIMHNALQVPQVERLVQVGIRDYCEAEADYAASDERIQTFFDRDLKRAQFEGKSWQEQVREIVETLPKKVYVSFDIDGLDPKLCPNTGTPVAGGFEVEQVLYLLEEVLKSGRQFIGMDLNEVAPGEDEWDANVGARLLYRMANIFLSQA